MKILTNGHFSFEVSGAELAKGLRSSAKVSRGKFTLEKSSGAVGIDGELTTLPAIDLHAVMDDALVIKNDFPFPQIFILDNHVLVCNRDSILELVGSTPVLKLSLTDGGELWSATSSCDFIYLSNGDVSVVRDPNSGVYALSSAPVCSTVCNFNGQIICGNIR